MPDDAHHPVQLAARQKRARAVALSLVYPEDDASLPGELALLRESLPAETTLLVGGRACELLGQRKEALDYFRKALAMHPADHLAKEGLKRVSEDK